MSVSPSSSSLQDLKVFQKKIQKLDAALKSTRNTRTIISGQQRNCFEFGTVSRTRDHEFEFGNCYVNEAKKILAETKVIYAEIELKRTQDQYKQSLRRVREEKFNLRKLKQIIEDYDAQLTETAFEQHHTIPSASSAQPVIVKSTTDIHTPPALKKIKVAPTSKNAQSHAVSYPTEPCHPLSVRRKIKVSTKIKPVTEEVQSVADSSQTELHHSSSARRKLKATSTRKLAINDSQSHMRSNIPEPILSLRKGKLPSAPKLSKTNLPEPLHSKSKLPSAKKPAAEKAHSHAGNDLKTTWHSSTSGKDNKLSSTSKQALEKAQSDPKSNLTEPCHSENKAKKIKLPSARKQATEKTQSDPTNTLMEPSHSENKAKKIKLPSASKQAIEKARSDPTSNLTSHSENKAKKIKLSDTSKSVASSIPTVEDTIKLPSLTKKPIEKSKTDARNKATEFIHSPSGASRIRAPSDNQHSSKASPIRNTENERPSKDEEIFKIPESPDLNAANLIKRRNDDWKRFQAQAITQQNKVNRESTKIDIKDPNAKKPNGNSISKPECQSMKASVKAPVSTSEQENNNTSSAQAKTPSPVVKQTTEDIITMISSLEEKSAVDTLGFNFPSNSPKKVKIIPFIPQSSSTPKTNIAKKCRTTIVNKNITTDVAWLAPKAIDFSENKTAANTRDVTKKSTIQKFQSDSVFDKLKTPSLVKSSAAPLISPKIERSPASTKPRTEAMISMVTQKDLNTAPSDIKPLTTKLNTLRRIDRFPSATKKQVSFSQSLIDIDVASEHHRVGAGEKYKQKLTKINKKPIPSFNKQPVWKPRNIISDAQLTSLLNKPEKVYAMTGNNKNIDTKATGNFVEKIKGNQEASSKMFNSKTEAPNDSNEKRNNATEDCVSPKTSKAQDNATVTNNELSQSESSIIKSEKCGVDRYGKCVNFKAKPKIMNIEQYMQIRANSASGPNNPTQIGANSKSDLPNSTKTEAISESQPSNSSKTEAHSESDPSDSTLIIETYSESVPSNSKQTEANSESNAQNLNKWNEIDKVLDTLRGPEGKSIQISQEVIDLVLEKTLNEFPLKPLKR